MAILSIIPDRLYHTERNYPELLMRAGTIQEAGILDFLMALHSQNVELTKQVKNKIVIVVCLGFISKHLYMLGDYRAVLT